MQASRPGVAERGVVSDVVAEAEGDAEPDEGGVGVPGAAEGVAQDEDVNDGDSVAAGESVGVSDALALANALTLASALQLAAALAEAPPETLARAVEDKLPLMLGECVAEA